MLGIALASLFFLDPDAAGASTLPRQISVEPPVCHVTRISRIGPRLEGASSSGYGIAYRNGHRQVSYDEDRAVSVSRAGDRVRLCLISRPAPCPPGDSRGARYAALNLRTGGRWVAGDSEHLCGGA